MGHTMDVERQRRLPGVVVTLAVVGPVVLLIVGLLVQRGLDSEVERIEREHGVSLPASAASIERGDDSPDLISRLVGLDRSATVAFTIPADELEPFLDQFSWDEEFVGEHHWTVVEPSGPSIVSWDPAQLPHRVLLSHQPPTSADLAVVEIYAIPGDDRVGVWLMSNWN